MLCGPSWKTHSLLYQSIFQTLDASLANIRKSKFLNLSYQVETFRVKVFLYAKIYEIKLLNSSIKLYYLYPKQNFFLINKVCHNYFCILC